MTFYVEEEADAAFAFPIQETAKQVMLAVLEQEKCPYEAQVNLLLTDDEGIRGLNREHRDMDSATDVLSFPNLKLPGESDFSVCEDGGADCFDPDTGELVLGDIVISVDKVRAQAAEYGHGEKREFAFLVAHSMYHLCGYDHMTEADAKVMEERQEAVLLQLGITR